MTDLDTTTETAWADPEAAARRYYLEAQTALQDDAPWEALAPSFRAGLTNEAAAWARALVPRVTDLQRAAKVVGVVRAGDLTLERRRKGLSTDETILYWLADAIERGEDD